MRRRRSVSHASVAAGGGSKQMAKLKQQVPHHAVDPRAVQLIPPVRAAYTVVRRTTRYSRRVPSTVYYPHTHTHTRQYKIVVCNTFHKYGGHVIAGISTTALSTRPVATRAYPGTRTKIISRVKLSHGRARKVPRGVARAIDKPQGSTKFEGR